GWLGSVVAYLALAIVGLTSHDAQTVRAAYLSMEVIGWFVIVPFSFATLATGLVESLGTPWGLFRHWWVLVEVPADNGWHYRPAAAHADSNPYGRRSGKYGIVRQRFPRAANSTRDPCWG